MEIFKAALSLQNENLKDKNRFYVMAVLAIRKLTFRAFHATVVVGLEVQAGDKIAPQTRDNISDYQSCAP